MPTSRPVLIVDGTNLFVRSWAAYPQMSSHGYQMGGCIGFLKTLRRLVAEQQPSAVYVCWESGGSQRRRALYPQYKLNRRPEKLNRFYGDDIPDSEDNRQHQHIALVGMMRCVPACQLYVQDCEGDDVIAYLCRNQMRNVSKVIASSDKDFYQLLDADTKIYSLHKKTYVTEPDVLVEYRVKAQNFAIAKALCGDPGDNVPGIKGVGFKTVAKMYPFLGMDQEILLQEVIDYASAHKDESSVHKRVSDQQEDIRRNYKLVYLDGGMLSATQAASVNHVVETFKPKIDKMGLVKLLVKEGIGDFDVEGFFYSFNVIDGLEYKVNDK